MRATTFCFYNPLFPPSGCGRPFLIPLSLLLQLHLFNFVDYFLVINPLFTRILTIASNGNHIWDSYFLDWDLFFFRHCAIPFLSWHWFVLFGGCSFHPCTNKRLFLNTQFFTGPTPLKRTKELKDPKNRLSSAYCTNEVGRLMLMSMTRQ